MMIRLYCDEDSMRNSLVNALRARGMDVTTARENNMVGRPDAEHLDYATRQERVLFSFNRGDYLRLHAEYLAHGKRHAGIVLASQQQYSIGETMRRVLYLSAALTPQAMENRVEFLSAWSAFA